MASKFNIFGKIKLLKACIKPKKNQIKDIITTDKNKVDFRGVYNFRPAGNNSIVRKEEVLIRICCFVIAGLLIVVLLEGFAIFTLVPLKKIEPLFLSVASENKQVYWVEPLKKTTTAFKEVTKSLLFQYVTARESVDLQTERDRSQFIKWISSSEIYSDFLDAKKPVLEDAKSFKLGRAVKIIVVSLLNDHQAQVDFELFEFKRTGGELVKKSTIRATITFKYVDTNVTVENQYMNPLGLEVTDYSLSIMDTKQFILLPKKSSRENNNDDIS